MTQDNHPQTASEIEEAIERHGRLIRAVLRLLSLDEIRRLVSEIEATAATKH